MRILLKSISYIFLLTFSFNAICQEICEQATHWSDEKALQILSYLSIKDDELKKQKIDDMIDNDFSINKAALFSLGRYQKDLDEDIKDKYFSIFKDYVKAVYKSFPLNIDINKIKYEIKSCNISQNDDISLKAIIIQEKTEINPKTNQEESSPGMMNIELILKKDEEKIKLFDIKAEGLSFLITVRDKFEEMLKDRAGDIWWFIDDLSVDIKAFNNGKKQFLF